MKSWTLDLHEQLRELTILAKAQSQPRASKDYVLYWICTAQSIEENPALDVARWFAMPIP